MRIATNLPDEVVRVRITAYQRVPGKGKGHLSSRYTKSITLVETTLQETFNVVEAALIGYCERGGTAH
jgi:hypothetical protein